MKRLFNILNVTFKSAADAHIAEHDTRYILHALPDYLEIGPIITANESFV